MSETIQPSLISRLRYTPMRDLLRFRATGRLDLKRLVANSGLPVPAQQLIHRVVRRTRLWSLEKADGPDRTDDGGKPLIDKRGEADNYNAAIGSSLSRAFGSDWILFPQPRNPNTEDMPEN